MSTVPGLKRVLQIEADKFIKLTGTSLQFLKADGSIDNTAYTPLTDSTLQAVTDRGSVTTNTITAASFIKSGGDGTNVLLDNGNVKPLSYFETEGDYLPRDGSLPMTGDLSLDTRLQTKQIDSDITDLKLNAAGNIEFYSFGGNAPAFKIRNNGVTSYQRINLLTAVSGVSWNSKIFNNTTDIDSIDNGGRVDLIYASTTGNKINNGTIYGLYVDVDNITGSGNTYAASFIGGHVGIGTDTPTEKLDVVGNIKGDNLFLGDEYGIHWGDNMNRLRIKGNENLDKINFITDNQSRVEINNSGIEVNGAIKITNNSYILSDTDTSLRLQATGTGNFYLGNGTHGGRIYHYSQNNDGKYASFSYSGSTYDIQNLSGDIRLVSNVVHSGDVKTGGLTNAAGIWDIENGVIRIDRPKGGTLYTGSTNTTGAIKIKLPISIAEGQNYSTLFNFTVTIYDHYTSKQAIIYITGQNNKWISNSSAHIISNNYSADLAVRFGSDSTHNCIWLGELDTSWRYTNISITDFVGSFNDVSTKWAKNWELSIASVFDTIAITRTNNLVASDYNKLKNLPTTLSGFGLQSEADDRYVNIGGDTMTGPLKINGGGAGSDVRLIVGSGGNGTLSTRHIEGKHWDNDSPHDLYINNYSNRNVFMATGGGRVGIGLAGPSERLHVAGNVLADSFIKSGGTGTNVLLDDGTVKPLSYFETEGDYLLRDGSLPMTGTLQVEDGEIHFGDISADHWTRLAHVNVSDYGFTFQHGNATVIVNEQGTINQAIVLADTDPNSVNTLFGISSKNSTSDWIKFLDLRGDGELFLGSSSQQVYHTGNLTNVSQLTNDAGYISNYQTLSWDVNQGKLSISNGNTVDIDRRYLHANIYSAANGVLVKTDISASSDSMFYLDIKGHGYSSLDVVQITLQGYNYNTSDNIINVRATALGITPEIKIFNYEGYLCFWWSQTGAYQSYSVFCNKTMGQGHNRVTTILNEAYPTTGVTREVTITPKLVWNDENHVHRSDSENDARYVNLDGDTMTGPLSIDYNNATQLTLNRQGHSFGNAGIKFTQDSNYTSYLYGASSTHAFKFNYILDEVFRIDHDGSAYVADSITADSFIKSGGTSSQFLKADGSVDSTAYLSSIYHGSTGADYDTVTKSGVHRMVGGANGPLGGYHTTMLSAFQSDTNAWGWQIASETGSYTSKIRYKSDSTAPFSAWYTLLHDGNHSHRTDAQNDSRYLQSETDTLDSVTDRGNTTTNTITVGGITSNGVINTSSIVDSATNIGKITTPYLTIPDSGWFNPVGYSTMVKPDSVGGVGAAGFWSILGVRDTGNGYTGIFTPYSINYSSYIGINMSGGNPTWHKIWTDNNLTNVSQLNNDAGYLTAETDSQTLSWDATSGNLSISNGNTVELDGRYLHGLKATYNSVSGDTGTDEWYNLFNCKDSTNSPITCNIRAYAHTSMSFVVVKGYNTIGSITILNYTSSSNAGYRYIQGVRLLTDGTVQIKLNGDEADGITLTQIDVQVNGSDLGNIGLVSALTVYTGTPAVVHELTDLSLNKGIITTNVLADNFIKSGATGSNVLLDDGNVKALSDFEMEGDFLLRDGSLPMTGQLNGTTFKGSMYKFHDVNGDDNWQMRAYGTGSKYFYWQHVTGGVDERWMYMAPDTGLNGYAGIALRPGGVDSLQLLSGSGDALFFGDINIKKPNAWLTLDSPGTGGNNTDQGAGISIGESGYKGAAAFHITYTGDGWSHIGMGTVDVASNIPNYSAIKLHYLSNNVSFNGTINANHINISGNSRLEFNTHGGGWYMQDSTWIRTSGDKSIYQNTGIIRTDGTLQVGSNGSTLNVPNGGIPTIDGNTIYHAGNLINVSQLNNDIGYAIDSQVVHLTGNQIIYDTKTFISAPSLPSGIMGGSNSDLNVLPDYDRLIKYERFSSSAANLHPGVVNNANGILTLTSHGGPYGKQISFGDTDDLYIRQFSNNNPTTWRKLWHDGNLTNVSQLINDAGYITEAEDNQTLSWDGDLGKIYISAGNSIDIDGRYLPLTGGTLTDSLTGTTFYINSINARHHNDYILRDHSNGNVTLSAAGADLYLGYQHTANIRLNRTLRASNGTTIIIDSSGKLYYYGEDLDVRYVQSSNYSLQTVTDSGNVTTNSVSIGTSNPPTETLQVDDGFTFHTAGTHKVLGIGRSTGTQLINGYTGEIRLNPTSGELLVGMTFASGTTGNANSISNILTLNKDGNVGIGAPIDSVAKLTVGDGGILIDDDSPLNFDTTSNRNKIRLYNNNLYTIGFEASVNFGSIDNYWAQTFQVGDASGVGFWWGDNGHTSSQGAMALDSEGRLTVATNLRIGYGESDTVKPNDDLVIDANGQVTITKTDAPGETVFDIHGSVGQLFSITDSLEGDLFSVNDISGLPILNVNSEDLVEVNAILSLKSGQSPSLTTGTTVIKEISAAEYKAGVFEYAVTETNGAKRAGTVQAIWGTTVSYRHESTTDVDGSTSDIDFDVVLSGGMVQLRAIVTSGTWTVDLSVRTL